MGNRLPKPSNKLMVDKLVEDPNHIKSANVESVFRAVDRAFYYELQDGQSVDPYIGQPWQNGNLHLSAPCIYAKVVESLDLRPGLSFLNLGSGTGYLNTIIGLLIGPNGLNHGIEIHRDVIDYAYKKLEEFKRNSCAIYKWDFSEPVFVHGNCLHLNTDKKYDRVYLGAACLPDMEAFIKKLVNLDGGILIMPYENHLVKYTRVDETTWTEEKLIEVRFTMMIGHNNLVVDHSNSINDDTMKMIDMPKASAKSLKELCRIVITQRLRHKTNLMNPNLLHSDNIDRRRHRRAMASLAMHRVEEQRQADAIRAQREATAAAAALAASPNNRRKAARYGQSRMMKQSGRGQNCCRGIRGEHPLPSTAECSSSFNNNTKRTRQARILNCPSTGHRQEESTNGSRSMERQSEFATARVLTRSATRQLNARSTLNASSTQSSSDLSNRENHVASSEQVASLASSSSITQSNSSTNQSNLINNQSGIGGRVEREWLSSNTASTNPLPQQVHTRRSDFRSQFIFNDDEDNSSMLGYAQPCPYRQSPLTMPRFGTTRSGSSTIHSFNANEAVTITRPRYSRHILRSTAKLCCPMKIRQRALASKDRHNRLLSAPGRSKSLRGRSHRVLSNGRNLCRRLTRSLAPYDTSDDGHDDFSSASSDELSWSTISSLCEAESSQNSSMSDLLGIVNEESVGNDNNDEDIDSEDDDGDFEDENFSDDVSGDHAIRPNDDQDEDDDDDESSLGESWDSFLIDANGDNADTSDEDDVDYHDDDLTIQAHLEVDMNDDNMVDESTERVQSRNRQAGSNYEETPVSSRLRSSQFRSSTDVSADQRMEAKASQRAKSSRNRLSSTMTSADAGVNSALPDSFGRDHGFQGSSHVCRRHRANLARINNGPTTSRSRSSSGDGSGENESEHLERRNRCRHSKSRRHSTHKCRWHMIRQQQRQQLSLRCPMIGSSSSHPIANLTCCAKRSNNVSNESRKESNRSAQARIRARLHAWLTGRLEACDPLTRSHSAAVPHPYRTGPQVVARPSVCSSLRVDLQLDRFRNSNTALKARPSSHTGTSSSASIKRKRQVSSSSDSSAPPSSAGLETSAHGNEPSSHNMVARHSRVRRLRTLSSRFNTAKCSCGRVPNVHPTQGITPNAPPDMSSRLNPSGIDKSYFHRSIPDSDAEASSAEVSHAQERRTLNRQPKRLRDSALAANRFSKPLCYRRHSSSRHCRCPATQEHSLRNHPRQPMELPPSSSTYRNDSRQQTRRWVEERQGRGVDYSNNTASLEGQSSARPRSVGVNLPTTTRELETKTKIIRKKRRENECEKYRSHITNYIRLLPLPRELRNYLNHDRPT